MKCLQYRSLSGIAIEVAAVTLATRPLCQGAHSPPSLPADIPCNNWAVTDAQCSLNLPSRISIISAGRKHEVTARATLEPGEVYYTGPQR